MGVKTIRAVDTDAMTINVDDVLAGRYGDPYDSVLVAVCRDCDAEGDSIEPDGRGGDCEACGAKGTMESPLITLGLI